MKFPALTRIFSLVLAILCLTMFLAGLGSVGAAMKDRSKGLAEHDRLSERLEEYRNICTSLNGGVSYQESSQLLSEEQEKHDAEASQHRMDLAVYTATRSGLQTGEAALAEAEATFLEGKTQYEEGLAQFQAQESAFWSGYFQFQDGKQQLAQGRQTLELAAGALGAVRGQLQQSRSMAQILESDDENARQQLTVAAYDSLLQALDSAVVVYDALKTQGGISPEQMQSLAEMMAQQSGVDLSQYLGDISWPGISEESLQDLESRVAGATGMSTADIRALIQQRRDEAAGMDASSPISEEQFEALKAAYAQSKGLAEQIYSVIDGKLGEYEGQIAAAKSQMDAAQAQIDALEPFMQQGSAAIEQARQALELAGAQIAEGEAGLAEGRKELEAQQAELKEKEEALRQEKSVLDQQALDLAEQNAAVTDRRDLERRETSLRLMLQEREDIRESMAQGRELLPAGEECARELLRSVEDAYSGKVLTGALMLFGGIFGFAGIPAAFEKTRSRFWLFAPTALCFGCSAAAEILCRLQERGDSYSALAAAAFALILLAIAIPGKKKA